MNRISVGIKINRIADSGGRKYRASVLFYFFCFSLSVVPLPTRRYDSVILAIARCLSVCLSVTTSQVGIVSKRMNAYQLVSGT